MSEELEQDTTPEEVVSTSEVPEQETKPGEADTPEVIETDEQKNERVQREAAERSERKARGVQKRMDELTADKYAERKRADELAATNARILALLEGKQTQAQPSNAEPQRDDFADDVQYLRAVARYDAEQAAEAKAAALIEQRTKQEQERIAKLNQEQQQQAIAKEFIARRKEAEKSIPDYRSVIEDWEPTLPNSVQDMILRLPDGPVISYHLAKNPELEAQFHNQPDYMHGVLLGQLLTTIKASAKSTSAPAPGKPVAAKGGTSTEPPSDPELYRAWADKNLK